MVRDNDLCKCSISLSVSGNTILYTEIRELQDNRFLGCDRLNMGLEEAVSGD